MNVARLRVIYFECSIRPVSIHFVHKLLVKRKYVIRKMQGKFSHIFAFSFTAQKLPPCHEQVFNRNDIIKNMTRPSAYSLSLSHASILTRIKEGYLFWMSISPHIAKGARYTIGARIENKLLDLLELAYIAYFTEKGRKEEKINECILVTDTLKFLVSIAWEGKLISDRQCEDIAKKLEEIGRMLGGWKKSLGNPEKKNRAF